LSVTVPDRTVDEGSIGITVRKTVELELRLTLLRSVEPRYTFTVQHPEHVVAMT